MTFYELIRACLIEDAKKHPYPGKGCGLSALSQQQDGDQNQKESQKDPGRT